MAISLVLNGFMLVMVMVTLLTLPLFYTLPFDDALYQYQCAVVITGWLWLIIAPAALGLMYVLRYLKRRSSNRHARILPHSLKGS